jgi:hypothetical protein
MGNVNAGDMIFNTERDLSQIGINSDMIRSGAIDSALEAKLKQHGYPVARIKSDMEAVRSVRFRDSYERKYTKA